MNFHNRYGSGSGNPLEWCEIQIASGFSFEVFAECIAHLVSKSLIESGTQKPGFLEKIVRRQNIWDA